MISSEGLQVACQPFQIPLDQVQLIRSNSNYIYDCGDRILRLTPEKVRSVEVILAELNWVQYLSKQDLPVVEIITSNRGEICESIEDPMSADRWIAVCFDKIKGDAPDASNFGPQLFQDLGHLTAKIHTLSEDYLCSTPFEYQHWDEIPEHQYISKFLPKDQDNLPELYYKLLEHLHLMPKDRSNYGLVHYDIHQGNYLIPSDRQTVLFDFEMCCQTWFINDIAACFYYALRSPLARRDPNFQENFLLNFYIGYEEVLPIEKDLKKWIPSFLLYRDLLILAYIKRAWQDNIEDQKQKMFRLSIRNSIRTRRVGLGM